MGTQRAPNIKPVWAKIWLRDVERIYSTPPIFGFSGNNAPLGLLQIVKTATCDFMITLGTVTP